MKKIYLKFLLVSLVLFVFNSNKSIAQVDAESNCFCIQPLTGKASLLSTDNSQTLLLKPGWNLISFDVSPADKTIGSVFADIINSDNLVYISGFDVVTKFYNPDGPEFLNTLTEIKDGFGYWVKVHGCDVLHIDGTPIDDDFTKPFDNGWNLVAYPPDSPQSISTYFQNVVFNTNNPNNVYQLQFVKGFTCETGTQTYNPFGPPFLNTLVELRNGLGYWVKVGFPTAKTTNNLTNVFSFINGTSNLPVGEKVKVLNEAGETIAILDVVQDNYLMTTTIYGDDVTTVAKENISIGENLRFSWNNQVLDFTTTFKGDYDIETVNLEFKLENLTNSLTVKAYPIPAKDVLNLEIAVEEKTDLWLQIFDTKGRLIQNLNNTSLSAGKQVISRNIENLTEGIYTYRLITNNQLSAGKFNVVR